MNFLKMQFFICEMFPNKYCVLGVICSFSTPI